MTLDELRVIVTDIFQKSTVLAQKTNLLQSFMTEINAQISPNNSFVSTINIDQFVAIQTPLYLALLHDIEVAADALGTDLT